MNLQVPIEAKQAKAERLVFSHVTLMDPTSKLKDKEALILSILNLQKPAKSFLRAPFTTATKEDTMLLFIGSQVASRKEYTANL